MSDDRDPIQEGDTLYNYRRRIEEEEARLRQSVEEHLIRKGRLEKAKAVLGTAKLGASEPLAGMMNAAPAASSYRIMPERATSEANQLEYRWWRVELHPSETNLSILGLDILDDVIVGRGDDPAANPDLDLETYGGSRHGVSRQHALLRPTETNLYLTDLGSTNGTRYNGIRLAKGNVYALNHNDVISFGNVVFQVKILHSPRSK
jgi:hypothetical protein